MASAPEADAPEAYSPRSLYGARMILVFTVATLALLGAGDEAAAVVDDKGAVVGDKGAVVDDKGAAVVDDKGAVVDPASDGTVIPPLPSDDELKVMAERDAVAARGLLRRAARTAASANTRSLALRLLAENDASVATARICARSVRLDTDALARRAGAECLGRLGPKMASPHTPVLVAALDDSVLDVVTMAGWALANAGDAAAIGPLTSLTTHPDVRVAKLFYGYAERLRDRLGLGYAGSDPSQRPRPSADAPTAVPPGVVLSFPALSVESAAATGWLGLYGVMVGWIHGPLLLSAHGGQGGAEAGALAGLGLSAIGAAALSGYGFSRAERLPLAHTVVQMGTFGGLAGYGAGQLAAVGPASGVASANLSALGTIVGIGSGIALVETAPPSVGALTAGALAGVTVGVGAGSLAASYKYPFNQSLGTMLFSGSVAGAATTVLLGQNDVGLFPIGGAAIGAGTFGTGAALLTTALESDPATASEVSGWIIVSGLAAGAAIGGGLGAMLPADADPFLESTLHLNTPALGVIPGVGGSAPATAVVLSGHF